MAKKWRLQVRQHMENGENCLMEDVADCAWVAPVFRLGMKFSARWSSSGSSGKRGNAVQGKVTDMKTPNLLNTLANDVQQPPGRGMD
jgi:hypothetical protein